MPGKQPVRGRTQALTCSWAPSPSPRSFPCPLGASDSALSFSVSLPLSFIKSQFRGVSGIRHPWLHRLDILLWDGPGGFQRPGRVLSPGSLFRLPFAVCAMLRLVVQSCPTLCDPMDYSPPGSSVHGILQPRLLEWVAMASSRGSSQPRSPALQANSLLSEPPGKLNNTGVGCLSLLQGISLTQTSNRGFLHCRHTLYQLSYQGSPHQPLLPVKPQQAAEQVHRTADGRPAHPPSPGPGAVCPLHKAF